MINFLDNCIGIRELFVKNITKDLNNQILFSLSYMMLHYFLVTIDNM